MRARRKRRSAFILVLPALLFIGACGFESVLGLATATDHPAPDGGTNIVTQPAIVTGSVPAGSLPALDPRDLTFLAGDGTLLSPSVSIDGENFTAGFPAGERYAGMIVAVRRTAGAGARGAARRKCKRLRLRRDRQPRDGRLSFSRGQGIHGRAHPG